MNVLDADGAAEAILQSPQVLRYLGDIIIDIKGASAGEALSTHLGKDAMLQAVSNDPTLLGKAGNKIHQTSAVIKGLLGGSEGTNLLKANPRLLKASNWSDAFIASYEEPYAPDMVRVSKDRGRISFTDDVLLLAASLVLSI